MQVFVQKNDETRFVSLVNDYFDACDLEVLTADFIEL